MPWEVKTCRCGCGNTLPNSIDKRAKGSPPRQFIRGHHTRSKEHQLKLQKARVAAGYARDEHHHNFLGDGASIAAIHDWVRRRKERTGICQNCGSEPGSQGRRRTGTEFANISREYRRDVGDYVELCIPCHRGYDSGAVVLCLGK